MATCACSSVVLAPVNDLERKCAHSAAASFILCRCVRRYHFARAGAICRLPHAAPSGECHEYQGEHPARSSDAAASLSLLWHSCHHQKPCPHRCMSALACSHTHAPHRSHPLLLQVQTNGEVTPIDALSTAVEDLSSEVDGLIGRFRDAVNVCKQRQDDITYG